MIHFPLVRPPTQLHSNYVGFVTHINRYSTQSRFRRCVLQISTVLVRDNVGVRVSTAMQIAATVVHEYETQCKHTQERNHTKYIRPNLEMNFLMFQLYLEQISTKILVMSVMVL